MRSFSNLVEQLGGQSSSRKYVWWVVTGARRSVRGRKCSTHAPKPANTLLLGVEEMAREGRIGWPPAKTSLEAPKSLVSAPCHGPEQQRLASR